LGTINRQAPILETADPTAFGACMAYMQRYALSFRLLAITIVGVGLLTFLSRQVDPFVTVYAVTLAAFSGLIATILWRWPVPNTRLVFAGAALAHAITLLGAPAFEDDYFRFMWDGWRTIAAGTPYSVTPESFFTDPTVPPALRRVLDGINYPEYPTIYGPVLQFLFAATYALFGANPMGLQLLFIVANLAMVALLLRRHAPGQVALYAWNPLVIAETSLHLHPDGLMALAISAALMMSHRRPMLAGLMLGMAAGVKLVALAAWPLLIRMRPIAFVTAIATLAAAYTIFWVQGQGIGFDSTATFATQWHFNPILYEALFQLFGWNWARLAALAIAGALVVWMHARGRSIDDVPLAAIFGVILLFAPAVNSWYLLWILPFAVGRGQIWPFAAASALPLSYITGLNLGDPALKAFAVHPIARMAQWAILAMAIGLDWRVYKRRMADKGGSAVRNGLAVLRPKIAVIMPALNEEASISGVVTGIQAAIPHGLIQIIVVDNGCTDNTVPNARSVGALVVLESQRGYGAACLTGIATLRGDIDIVLFIDSDGSDVLTDASAILAPIIDGTADMVIGSRSLGVQEAGAMTAPQRFGNWLAPALIRLIWGVRYTDLGPFRAIRRSSLSALNMRDRDFGWTVEMQVRAAKLGLSTMEIPTGYRRRIGVSKISGTIDGVIKAGVKILYVIGREAFGDFGASKADRQNTNSGRFGR
jgi:Glycosyl transferase family 2